MGRSVQSVRHMEVGRHAAGEPLGVDRGGHHVGVTQQELGVSRIVARLLPSPLHRNNPLATARCHFTEIRTICAVDAHALPTRHKPSDLVTRSGAVHTS